MVRSRSLGISVKTNPYRREQRQTCHEYDGGAAAKHLTNQTSILLQFAIMLAIELNLKSSCTEKFGNPATCESGLLTKPTHQNLLSSVHTTHTWGAVVVLRPDSTPNSKSAKQQRKLLPNVRSPRQVPTAGRPQLAPRAVACSAGG
eukprot:1944831-Amphidinium_carterae.1